MKGRFKCKEGDAKEGRLGPSEVSCHSAKIPRWNYLSVKTLQKAPFPNPAILMHWSGPENIAQVRMMTAVGLSWTLVLPSMQWLQSMLRLVTWKSVCWATWLVAGWGVNNFGGLFSQLWGYIIVKVQLKGVWGYNEDQVALVIPDSTTFGSQVMVTLGMLTINWIINVIKESKIDELSASLNGSRIFCLLACCQAEPSVGRKTAANQTMDLTDLNEAVRALKK